MVCSKKINQRAVPKPNEVGILTKIIVTNDDGVQAPGILALATALRRLADVQVIGPALNQSASGHKKTLFQDIPVSEVALADNTRAMSVGGSPADCIALAALGMVEWPPALVVSGINRGANLGQDITYSGTVTAALEAAIQGVPAVAVSLVTGDYSRGAWGFWVEDGAVAHPVEEITIASNLKDMFAGIVAVGNDVDRRFANVTGSLLIEQMTMAGA